MQLSGNETTFILWAFGLLLGLLAFIGALGVSALITMSKDIGVIKISVVQQAAKHEGLEKRVQMLEDHTPINFKNN